MRHLRGRGRLAVSTAAVALLAACGGSGPEHASAATAPRPVLTATQVESWAADASRLRDDFDGAWPDVAEMFDVFADEATFYDPTSGDGFVEGKQRIVGLHTTMARVFPDIAFVPERLFVTARGFAAAFAAPDLWPPFRPAPVDPPPTRGLDVFEVVDGQVTEYVLYFSPDILEPAGMGCFAVDGCPALDSWVERYLAAWSSGDADTVAAMYTDQATFRDGVFGLTAATGAAVGDLATTRFGGPATVAVAEVERYAQTDGPYPATPTNPRGALVGFGIRYDWTVDTGDGEVVLDVLALVRLDGDRIDREDVYYEPGSLLASGLLP